MQKNHHNEIVQKINLSLNELIKSKKYYLYQVLYFEKYFGNIIVDIKSDLLGFRFISNRDENSAYVYLLEKVSCVFLFDDILRYNNAKPIKIQDEFFEYLKVIADILNINHKKFQDVFNTENGIEKLQEVLIERDANVLSSNLPDTSILFRAV